MAQRRKLRRLQRLLGLIILLFILLIIWPFIKPQINQHWPSNRFSPPPTPEQPVLTKESYPKTASFIIDSQDPALLKRLQEANYPGYINQGHIIIGPYLESFAKTVDVNKLQQVAGEKVNVVRSDG